MKYINARLALPEPLFRELQNYVQGAYIYVPSNTQRRWGELSGARAELEARNRKIRRLRLGGASVDELAERYCLSASAIRKILYQK